MVAYMTKQYGTIAANINWRTAAMWEQFKDEARAAGMSNTSALEHAAELWLKAHEQPRTPSPVARELPPRTPSVDPFARNAPQPAPEPPPVIKDTYVPPSVNPFA